MNKALATMNNAVMANWFWFYVTLRLMGGQPIWDFYSRRKP